ncbi:MULTISPECIES: IS200/IS605 family transposase [Chryseobacterium]|uniref:Transposase n=1 Tax=Chryseobacterium camelliae TaxID=1265445 RepID=A0ABU0TEA0_9FLAO|nr:MULTISPECIES: IS200/IS605 family transposase [Chryseobacterium]MDT3406921.1 putative transposase [Pseudacidovorax intermedius]MDQ1095286.1 putative transposase [Chryseobacterium camelliae]MDQ1099225.1 putative transposase [Chryseobacterium sp. SORGH_AS_1048]MDR6086574.1 putative transposase [Chryseobacterium sp. SORGH_AS_0909]MDR6130944.1 putative transposase [Chryseobacterium sp. SORGH_AS_1175]
MPFIKIYIHLVFSTKNRIPFFNTSAVRVKVWKHIKENASEKGIYVDMVNGFSDHCHCLISLGSNQNIEKVVQLIKGESSFWINKNELTREKFAWQDEYFAVSVSKSMVELVRNYIRNQEIHHTKQTFEQEYLRFKEKYGFE